LLSLVAGVRPLKPAFREVLIQPALGELQAFVAEIAHQNGLIKVSYKRTSKNGLQAEITLPEKLAGVIEWNGKRNLLTSGKQTVNFQ